MKVRVLEVECDSAQALEMVRELAGLAKPAAQVEVVARRALPAPQRRREAVSRAEKAAGAEDDLGQKGQKSAAILEALREGPKTAAELADRLKSNRGKVSSLLTYMRQRGRVGKGPGHRPKWELR